MLTSDIQTPEAALKLQDEDRWLAAQFAPSSPRAALIALYGVDAELRRARTVTAEPTIVQIRHQWWRDAIEEIAGGKPARRHPVALSLEAAMGAGRAKASLLVALIDARERAAFGETEFAPGETPADKLAEACCLGLLGETDAGAAQALAPAIAAYEAARAGRKADAETSLALFRRTKRVLLPALWPAAAPAALVPLYLRTPDPGPLSRRWRLWRAVAFGAV